MADNPVLRKLLQAVTIKNLSQYDSKDTGWHSTSNKKVKFTIGTPLFSKEISVRYEAETWTWLDHPGLSLSIVFTEFDVTGERISFGLEARARVSIWAWGHIPNVVKGDVGGSAQVGIMIAGSTQVGKNHLSHTEINRFHARLINLPRFSNGALNPLMDLIQDSINKAFLDNDARVDDIKAAIDGVTF